MKVICLLFAGLTLLAACNNNKPSENDKDADTLIVNNDSLSQETTLLALSKKVLNSLKNKDYATLSTYIHPDLGIRFSPYAYIDTTAGIVMTSAAFMEQVKADTKLNWGVYDGTGEEIKLTTKEYLQRFVYDVDFLNAEKTTVNQSSAQGNSINNISQIYPAAVYTESYFSGFDKKYGGMDWRALRLVYEKVGDRYYLVALVHDQWTI